MTEFRISSTCQPRRTQKQGSTFPGNDNGMHGRKAVDKGTAHRTRRYTSLGAGWVRGGSSHGTSGFLFSIRCARAKKERARLPELYGDTKHSWNDPPQAFRPGDDWSRSSILGWLKERRHRACGPLSEANGTMTDPAKSGSSVYAFCPRSPGYLPPTHLCAVVALRPSGSK